MATEKPPEKRKLPQRATTAKKRKNMDPDILKLRGVVQKCCAVNDLATAWSAYEAAIKAGTRIEPHVFYCLMSLCDGLGDRGIHVGTPSAFGNASAAEHVIEKQPSSIVPDCKRQEYSEIVFTHMQQLKLPLKETAYTALVRLHARAGSVDRAVEFLTEAEATQQCKVKLRLYTPVLVAFATTGDIFNALEIWKRLVARGLRPAEKEFRVLLENTTTVALAERLLSELAEEVLVPSRDTSRTIQSFFEKKLGHNCLSGETNKATAEILETINPLPVTVFPLSKSKATEWTVSPSCLIDPETGALCSGCLKGCSLQPVTVTETSRKEMMDMNNQMARTGQCINHSSYQGGGKGPKVEVKAGQQEKRERKWQSFLDYLDTSGPMDVVIDGANVGYYEQNFSSAPKHVNYEQIDVVVSMFLAQNKKAVVFLHSRHCSQPLMPDFALDYLEKWKGALYQTPPGMNDDWFWLQAALVKSAQVVTNDEMRDHHFQMVAPRAFLRWRERHQIHFSLGAGRKGVLLHYPSPYSRRIQAVGSGLVVPLPKQGDVNRFLDGAFVAGDEEPEEETYLCICPNAPVANPAKDVA